MFLFWDDREQIGLKTEGRKINGEGGIRTRGRGVYPYDGLANRCLQPLGHLSKSLLKKTVHQLRQILNSI